MNYKLLGKILGKITVLESVMMLAPLAVSVIYREDLRHMLAFLIPAICLFIMGVLLQRPKPERVSLVQKEGFALVASAWIFMTLFAAVPLVINGDIPNYVDACFEMMSGFTTTGASIVSDISVLSRSTLFWRSFSHWIGGMGILVFVLIFIPESNEGSAMHLLRAESPGPQVGKITSKMKMTSLILYLIYAGLTLITFILLLLGGPVPGYEGDHVLFSLLTAFGAAGTGGFGVLPGSMELYSAYSQYVISIALIVFGCNFALYHLILIGKIKEVVKSEEFRTYLIIVLVAVLIIFTSLTTKIQTVVQDYTVEESFRHALFQVASIMTTTGYSTTDFGVWPPVCIATLVMLMFFGAMAGSTAGGIKLSRIVIAIKGIFINVRKLVNPRYVPKAKFESNTLERDTINDVFSFITLYFFFITAVFFLLSFDPVNGQTFTIVSDAGSYEVTHGFFSNFSATLACISNIGPGFEAVGPYASFAAFSPLSKILLAFTMLLGRLEILPVLILFSPKTWKKV